MNRKPRSTASLRLTISPDPDLLRAAGAPGPRIDASAVDHGSFVAPFEHAPAPLTRHVRTQPGALPFEIVTDIQLRILELNLVRCGLNIHAVDRKGRFAFPGSIRRGIECHADGAAVSRRVAFPLPGVASRQIAVRAVSSQNH